MRFVIWGAGFRGRILLSCMKRDSVVAFVDKNKQLTGKIIEGKIIITPDEYVKKYADCFAVISTTIWEEEIKIDLHRYSVHQYFELRRSPVELSFYGKELPFREMLQHANCDNAQKTIALFGVNLFAIMLYDYMNKQGYENVLLVDVPEQRQLIEQIKKYYVDYKFISIEEVKKNSVNVLATDRFIYRNTCYFEKGCVNFFHFRYLSRYKYKDLSKFRNIHKDKRCFVIGNGPSVRLADLEILFQHREICMGMNEVYECFRQTSWRPNYYFIEDGPFNDKDEKMLKSISVAHIFVGDTRQNIPRRDNLYIYHVYRDYYEDEGPDFSDNPNYGTYNGHTILYTCLQFAAYMGFSEIYVIGADCSYNLDGEKNYFFNYDSTEYPPVKLRTDGVFKGYRKAREYAEDHNIGLYNATRGGKLEELERVDFDSLF